MSTPPITDRSTKASRRARFHAACFVAHKAGAYSSGRAGKLWAIKHRNAAMARMFNGQQKESL